MRVVSLAVCDAVLSGGSSQPNPTQPIFRREALRVAISGLLHDVRNDASLGSTVCLDVSDGAACAFLAAGEGAAAVVSYEPAEWSHLLVGQVSSTFAQREQCTHPIGRRSWLHDLEWVFQGRYSLDLDDLAHVSGWEPYNLRNINTFFLSWTCTIRILHNIS